MPDAWQSGRDLSTLGFGTVDGRADLRGFALADPATVDDGVRTAELDRVRTSTRSSCTKNATCNT